MVAVSGWASAMWTQRETFYFPRGVYNLPRVYQLASRKPIEKNHVVHVDNQRKIQIICYQVNVRKYGILYN